MAQLQEKRVTDPETGKIVVVSVLNIATWGDDVIQKVQSGYWKESSDRLSDEENTRLERHLNDGVA